MDSITLVSQGNLSLGVPRPPHSVAYIAYQPKPTVLVVLFACRRADESTMSEVLTRARKYKPEGTESWVALPSMGRFGSGFSAAPYQGVIYQVEAGSFVLSAGDPASQAYRDVSPAVPQPLKPFSTVEEWNRAIDAIAGKPAVVHQKTG